MLAPELNADGSKIFETRLSSAFMYLPKSDGNSFYVYFVLDFVKIFSCMSTIGQVD